jgi:expansin
MQYSHSVLAAAAVAAATLMLSAQTSAAGPYDPATTHRGEGTFYDYSGGGNCSFPVPTQVLTAAMNRTEYANSTACGAYVVVTNPVTNKSVTVRIDDQCPECQPGDIDLSRAAFEKISPLQAGRINIDWRYIASPASQIKIFIKEGSSQFYTAVQIRDARFAVRSFAFRQAGSGNPYVNVSRQPYNFFVKHNGMGPGPYDFRITDVHGRQLEIKNIPLRVATEMSTSKQLPPL